MVLPQSNYRSAPAFLAGGLVPNESRKLKTNLRRCSSIRATSATHSLSSDTNVTEGQPPAVAERSLDSPRLVSFSRPCPPPPDPATLAAVKSAYVDTNADPYAGTCAHFLSLRAATVLETSRRSIARFLNLIPQCDGTEVSLSSENVDISANVSSPLAFTSNEVTAWLTLARSLRAPHVLIAASAGRSAYEAFSAAGSEVSLLRSYGLDSVVGSLRSDTGAIVLPLACCVTGEVNSSALADVVEFIRGSGTGMKIVLGISTAFGRYPIDVESLGVDFVVGDGLGVRAPVPIGFFGGRQKAMDALAPAQGGDEVFWQVSLANVDPPSSPGSGPRSSSAPSAGMTPRTKRKSSLKSSLRRQQRKRASMKLPHLNPDLWSPSPSRFEPGMPSIAAVAGLATAVASIASQDGGLKASVAEDDGRLADLLVSELGAIDCIRVLSLRSSSDAGTVNADDALYRTGVVSLFLSPGSPRLQFLTDSLARQGLLVEAGSDSTLLFGEHLDDDRCVRITLFPGLHKEQDVKDVSHAFKEAMLDAMAVAPPE